MKNILWQFSIKKHSTVYSIIVITFYGFLIFLIPDFALWTSSISGDIYKPMKAFYSIHSIYSMTFIILPTYLFWIFSAKKRRTISLEIVRYISSDKYVNNVILNCMIEAIAFSLILLIIILISSYKMQWSLLFYKSLTTVLGLWFMNILAEIFTVIFKSNSFIPVCFFIAIIMCEYLLYCYFKTSFFICPLLSANNNETVITSLFNVFYSIFLLIISYLTLDFVIKRKSVY